VLSITGTNGTTIVINSGKHGHSWHGFVSRIESWATQLVIGVCLIILTAGAVAYFTRATPRIRATDWSRNIDERLSAFEKRTNDVQDILISIDDRLNRQTS
jgi:CHASE1-domain containing sensor protein